MIHSPRIHNSQMQRKPLSAQSLQTPVPNAHAVQAPRYSVPGGSSVSAPPAPEEVFVFTPSLTPRLTAQPPPLAGLSTPGGPWRKNGGSQPQMPPQRQFGGALSPRGLNGRELKLSMVGDPSVNVNIGCPDKENRDNIIVIENVMDGKDSRDHTLVEQICALKEQNAEQGAKLAEQSAKFVLKEQAFEQATADTNLQHLEATSLLERRRMDLEQQGSKAKEQQLEKQHLEKQLQNQREENQANLAELGQLRLEREGHKTNHDHCSTLEAQNAELAQRLQSLEQRHARSLSLAEQDKQEEMHNKDAQLQEAQALLQQKDLRLQDMEGLLHDIHDKDQALQQLKHERDALQKRDTGMQAQLHNLQAELAAAEKLLKAKPIDDREFKKLRQQLQEQKTLVESLDSQLRRASGAVSLATPGEFRRMALAAEARNSASQQNMYLSSRNTELESQATLIFAEISLLKRRLPVEVCNAVAEEALAAVAAEDLGLGQDEEASDEQVLQEQVS